MTGNLTISEFTKATKVYGSSGVDTLTATNNVKLTAYTGAGNDVVDVSAAATAGFDINTEAGDDTVIAGATAGATINTGTGNDTIITAAAVEITTGTGSDIVKMASAADGVIVTDFEKGVYTLVLTGAGVGINLTALTAPTAGAYNLDGSGKFDITLKNGSTAFTATNLADSIQLGSITAAGVKSAYTYTTIADANATVNIVAGDKNDVIKVVTSDNSDGTSTAETTNITLGAGADTLVVGLISGGEDSNTITVTDFVSGTDKIILEGTADAVLNLVL
ncbi:hypothetical protein NG754_10825 [Aliarcobacter cryaerophilus]|uniref:hypothetical protein n=1 Tax=Aliarcobacter cryaerophilus TaxID=28198 RepID=UPI003DA67007